VRRRALSLRFLGDSPSVLLDGTPVPVTLRPAELLAALALHPDGLTAERLALLLYGDDGNPTTVRGEVLRLRSLIGADVLRTRPYRLDADVDTDFGAVRRALAAGRPAEALRACAGPLLPRSDAPEIREERDALCVGLRRAVLAADETDLLADYVAHPLGRDDLQVHDRLLELMGPHDRRRPAVAAHRDRLLATA
jgi:DNA-binding SARP family transcriptional activator